MREDAVLEKPNLRSKKKCYYKMGWTLWHRRVSCNVPGVLNKGRLRKIHEEYYVPRLHRSLNNQLELASFRFSQNGVTQDNAFKLLLVSLGFHWL